MQGPKPCALPLGDAPLRTVQYPYIRDGKTSWTVRCSCNDPESDRIFKMAIHIGSASSIGSTRNNFKSLSAVRFCLADFAVSAFSKRPNTVGPLPLISAPIAPRFKSFSFAKPISGYLAIVTLSRSFVKWCAGLNLSCFKLLLVGFF